MLRGDTYKLECELQDSLNTQDRNWGWKVGKVGMDTEKVFPVKGSLWWE